MAQTFRCRWTWIILVAFLHQPVYAQLDRASQSPEVLEFVRCSRLTIPGARLECFDRAAAALGRAVEAGELIVVAKTEAEAVRRSRFGLPDNKVDLLGGREPAEIRGVIRSARNTADGWVVTLEDGSTWQQIEVVASATDPKPGLAVAIKRGALGSYRFVINPHAAFKVRRVR